MHFRTVGGGKWIAIINEKKDMVQSGQSSYQSKKILQLRSNQVHLSVQNKTHAIYMWDYILAELNNYLKYFFSLNIYT